MFQKMCKNSKLFHSPFFSGTGTGTGTGTDLRGTERGTELSLELELDRIDRKRWNVSCLGYRSLVKSIVVLYCQILPINS